MSLIEVFPSALSGMLLALAIWLERARNRTTHEIRCRQLESSTTLFQAHASATERFLSAKTAPSTLKNVLVFVSDGLQDKDLVISMAALMSRGRSLNDLDGADELVQELDQLRRHDQALLSDFTTSIISGVFASVLRWPESAKYFEEISANYAADPHREVDVVVTASNIRRSNLPFGLRSAGEAVA